MPFDIGGALEALSLGLKVPKGLLDVSEEGISKWLQDNKDSDAAKFYDKVQKNLEERRILGVIAAVDEKSNNDNVDSPNVRKLRALFGEKENGDGAHPCGVIYVLYDKKGNGKSHAGKALLREFFEFDDGQTIQGIMLSGDCLNDNIPNALCSELGASNVDGWISLLLLAMDQPKETNYPSILILDSFNSVGDEGANIKFVKTLYELMLSAERNIFVVVLTQEKEVAQELFNANGGARIIPLPGSMKGTPAAPEWKEEKWTMDELIEFVHYKQKGKYNDEEIRGFVSTDMTPLDVNKKLTSKRKLVSVPGRKGQKEDS